MTPLATGLAAITGALLASLLACVPGLHVYNVLGLALILTPSLELPPLIVASFTIGMIVGFAMLNTLPSVLLAAPDESAFLTVLPGQKYLLDGRGYEGAMITIRGSVIGMLILLLVMAPLAIVILPPMTQVLRPHTHWVLWCVIAFMLLSEWPMRGRLMYGGWNRFIESWKPLAAGLLTFGLSGLLGFLLFARSPIHAQAAFQNLMPAFVGLFTLPGLIVNLFLGSKIPAQRLGAPQADHAYVWQGALAGTAGGLFAAFFPVITGGVGGFLAGHAVATRDDRAFLASQGASKSVYYVGALLLFFVPGLNQTRGGAAWLLRGIMMPFSYRHYLMALAAAGLAGATATLLAEPLTRMMLALVARRHARTLSWVSLLLVLGMVLGVTGRPGLLIALTGTGIGLIPVLFGSRRMNCLGIILLPLACEMSGGG